MLRVSITFSFWLALAAGAYAAPSECAPDEISKYVSEARRAEAALDFQSKLAWYVKASVCGDASSMNELGWMYFGANDIPGRKFLDYSKAALWFTKAAQLNYAPAVSQLGMMYGSDGNYGVPKDDVFSAQLYLKAARQGDTQAMNSLGVIFSTGKGVSRNMDQALFWWNRAAKLGGPAGDAARQWLALHDGKPLCVYCSPDSK